MRLKTTQNFKSQVCIQGKKFTTFFLPAVVFIALSIQVPSCSVRKWEQSKSSVIAGGCERIRCTIAINHNGITLKPKLYFNIKLCVIVLMTRNYFYFIF